MRAYLFDCKTANWLGKTHATNNVLHYSLYINLTYYE